MDLATGKPKGLLSLPVRDPNARYSWRDRPLAKGDFTPDGRCLTIFLESGDVAMYELASGQVRRHIWQAERSRRCASQKFVTHQNGGPVTEPLYGPHLSISTDGRFLGTPTSTSPSITGTLQPESNWPFSAATPRRLNAVAFAPTATRSPPAVGIQRLLFGTCANGINWRRRSNHLNPPSWRPNGTCWPSARRRKALTRSSLSPRRQKKQSPISRNVSSR